MRGAWIVVALCLLPTAQAQLAIDDPTGDVHAHNADPVPPPQPLGIDLVKGAFFFDSDGVRVAITVDDMESIDNGSPWIGASTEYRATWEQAGFRDGRWGVRIFYSGSWSNMVEGPCLDGADSDGCAGSDRDIHDGVPMEVDAANETVIVLFPASILPDDNVTWSDFALDTSAVQSAYPAFFVDEASDDTGYRIVWPKHDSDDNATAEGADGGQRGRDIPFVPIAAVIGIAVLGSAMARRRP